MTDPAPVADPDLEVHDLDLLTTAEPCFFALITGRSLPRDIHRRLTGLDATELLAALEDPDGVAPEPHRIFRGAATEVAHLGAKVGRAAANDKTVHVAAPQLTAREVPRFTQALVTGAQRLKETPPRVQMYVRAKDEAAARTGATLGHRVLQARRLANTPSSVKTPQWLAERAGGTGVRVTTHDAAWLRTHRFGGVLAVGAGSQHPPNVTVMSYRGSDRGPHVVLIGKGITFDSGGLSLKPAAGMPLMKTDMSGAAAVIATLGAVADLELPIRVTGVIACAENMPSGSAMRPGDVVRHFGGRTTEVLNTDAEGRLVLADALAYAVAELNPDVLIDIATLTGAATVGLGRQHAALYASDDRLAAQLQRAGEQSGDEVWRLPLVPEYRAAIESSVADAANTNTDTVTQAGSITAALFLEPFTGGVPWAHLDIAGVGRTESERPDCRKGATGFGVALLTQWLRDRAR